MHTCYVSVNSEAGKQQDLLVSRKGRRKRADTEDTNGDTIDSSSDSEGDSADSCDSDDGGQSEPDSTSIKFLLVNPKSLQECKISYRSKTQFSFISVFSIQATTVIVEKTVRVFCSTITVVSTKKVVCSK